MCLLVFSLRTHADYPLIFAGNRDEFHSRPARPAHFWSDHPRVLAGRDLQAGGTWLGVTRDGRFATVTNYREPGERLPNAPSRGDLVVEYLTSDVPAVSYLDALQERSHEYNGFNLILGTADELYYFSNRGAEHRTSLPETNVGTPGRIHELKDGVYGLSNEQLDTPWPKVRRAKALFHKAIGEHGVDPPDLLDVLLDRERPPDDSVPSTGLTPEWERALSTIFIAGRDYGTRASTVVLFDRHGGATFVERSSGPEGRELGTETFTFRIEHEPKVEHD